VSALKGARERQVYIIKEINHFVFSVASSS